MADQKKVLRELRDVQDTMKRVERRITTTRFQAVKLPKKLEDGTPEHEEVPPKPKPPDPT
jgi:hypothetical protein